MDGAWHRCRNTGVNVDENNVWAYMYEDEVTGSPTIIAPILSAAFFQVSDLTVTPSEVEPGDDVTVSVLVTNVGEESGGLGVELELDGAVADIKAVTLDGGASTTVSFSVSSDERGSHTVEVGGLSGSFTVEKAKAWFPWTHVIVAIVLIAIVAYYFYSQRQ